MRHSQHTVTLGALNAELRLPIKNMCGARVDLRGTFVATVVLEGTSDGTNWTQLQLAAGGAIINSAVSTVMNAAGTFTSVDLAGFTEIRLRVSAYTSGSAVAVLSVTEESLIELVGIIGAPQVSLAAGTNVIGQTYNADNVFWNDSVTPQAAGATVTGTGRNANVANAADGRYSVFNAFAFADVAGTLRIEISQDNTTWRKATDDTVVPAGVGLYLSVPVTARYHRGVFVNGASVQTAFMFNTSFTSS